MTERYDGNLVQDVIDYEDGTMQEWDAVQFFSRLHKSGAIQHLQGSYGRGFEALVRAGYLSPEGDVLIEVAEVELIG